jgi:hypothetical protein
MRRTIVIALLSLGVVVGYGSGIVHMVAHHGERWGHCSHGPALNLEKRSE